MPIFGVTGSARTELAEVFNLLQGHIGETDQIMQRILQHGTVTGGQDEAVAVGPFRSQRVDFQKFRI